MTESLSAKNLECKDLYGYLNTLPPAVLDRLYDHPFTCLAVFRGLPALAKQYVMRTLFLEQPVPETFVATWIQKDDMSLHTMAVNKIKQLRIWRELSGGSAARYETNPIFQKNLKIALCGGGPVQPDTAKYGEDKHARDVPFLDKYAKERWESVLYFMTGSSKSEDGLGVSQDVVRVLINGGLLRFDPQDRSTSITSSGFQFLLLDTASQVWHFMMEYLSTAETRKMDQVECLSFLFQISFSTLGKDYSVEGLTSTQFDFMQHLREIGLVFQRKRKSRRFYPTRLALNLGSAVTGSDDVQFQEKGCIVVETNYRVYAYTNSSLQIALLSLFCDILCRFPNLCVAVLSRESVQQALASGITANQVLHFLRSRAHQQMLTRFPVIPATITDQIRLWELERDRLRYTDGVLYSQFLSQSDFETLHKYADDSGVLLWANTNKRLMVVSKSGHDSVKRYWKRLKDS